MACGVERAGGGRPERRPWGAGALARSRVERMNRTHAATDERLGVWLGLLGVFLAASLFVYAFILPQTPVRLGRASAALIDELPIWSAITSSSLPVPTGSWSIAVSIVAAAVVAFGAYGLAIYLAWGRRVRRATLAVAMASAIAFFSLSTLALPTMDTDIFNYIVTGRVAAEHDANPYVVAPDRFRDDPIYPYAGHQYTRYPDVKLPAWMLMSVPLARVAGDDPVVNLLAYRLLFLAFNVLNLILVAAIVQRLDPKHTLAAVVAFGWNPIVALFGESKVDTVMVSFLLLGVLLLVAARRRAGVVALTLSSLVKLITLPFLATVWLSELARRNWRSLALLSALVVVTVAALYLPFTRDGSLLLDHLGVLGRRGAENPNPVGSDQGSARLLLAIGFGILVLWVGLTQSDTVQHLLRGWGVLAVCFSLFLAPLGLSWYLVTLVAVVSLTTDWRLTVLAGVLSLSSFGFDQWYRLSSDAYPLPDVFALPRTLVYALPLAVAAASALAWRAWTAWRVRRQQA